ncbi:MAG: LD-carboxypeptidase [Lachnospiraceae bacterium]|nr:LD-carboxypeptidase [Lachnospiraceae bacterium]
MIYPDFLKSGDTIGVTGCSAGCPGEVNENCFNHAKEEFSKYGINVVLTENATTCEKGRSSDAKTRGAQLMALVKDPKVKAILAATGGDYLCEMLPYVDYEQIVKNPTWIQGYSDPTGLLFGITTKYDVATIYSQNFGEFGMDPWHKSLGYNLDILLGKEIIQESFDLFQSGWKDKVTGLEPYILDAPVEWTGLHKEKELSFKGRMIGGCLDAILEIIGTPFEYVKGFLERYKDDGIVWCLESFGLDSERLTVALWHLRQMGWFKYTKGIVFGRPCFFSTGTETTFDEAVDNAIGDMGIPIITNADIGHRKPSVTIINGAIGEFRLNSGKATLKTEFK